MPAPLTPAGEAAVADLAQRYRVSEGAVRNLLDAVIRGGGAMAQFSHPDLGGSGQWMRGGMTMVGDMFNSGLQSTVSGICSELSSLMASGAVLVTVPDRASGVDAFGSFGSFGGDWWPAELGRPSSSGGQNDASYAYFPGPRRLAIRRGGAITLYDTGDHAISGVQQQQGGRGSLEFSSQFGSFTVDSLPVVDGGSAQAATPASASPVAPAAVPQAGAAQPVVAPSVVTPSQAGQPFGQSQSQSQFVFPAREATAPPVAPPVPPAREATGPPVAPSVPAPPQSAPISAPAPAPAPPVTGTPAPEPSAPLATPAPTATPTPPVTASSPVPAHGTPAPAPATGSQAGAATTPAEIGAAIETLAGLRDKGFLTDEEFTVKKTELLARL